MFIGRDSTFTSCECSNQRSSVSLGTCLAIILLITIYVCSCPFEIPAATGITYDGLSGKHLHLLVNPGREYITNVFLVDTTPYQESFLRQERRGGVTLDNNTLMLGSYKLPVVYALYSNNPPQNDFRPRSKLQWDSKKRWARSDLLPDSIIDLDCSDRLMVIVELKDNNNCKYYYISKIE